MTKEIFCEYQEICIIPKNYPDQCPRKQEGCLIAEEYSHFSENLGKLDLTKAEEARKRRLFGLDDNIQ